MNRLIWLIDRCESHLTLFTLPLSNVFLLASFQNSSSELFKEIIEKLLKKKTESDLMVMENVIGFFVKSQKHQLYMNLALCIFQAKLPKNTRSVKLKLHAIHYIDKSSRKIKLKKIHRQFWANGSIIENASIYIEIGLGYRLISEYNSALSCFLIALQLLDDLKNQITIKCHKSLGLIYSDLGNYSLSLEHHNIALNMTQKIHGRDYFGAYDFYLNIGSILHLIDYKNINKSISYLRKGLGIVTRHLGSQHTEVATIYNNLGIAYAKNKDDKNAEKSYLKAYEIFQFIYPENSPWIATVNNNLASLYSNNGELEKALSFQKDALDIIMYNYGESNVMTAITQSTYAKILNFLNRKNEAIEQYQMTIKTFKKKLPNDHLYLQKAHCNLGVVYLENGAFGLAITCFLNSLKILDYHGNKYLNKKLELIDWIMKCYQEIGNLNKAEFFNKKKITILDTLNNL
jgi:tetratricopeptide (TPR) repeat protein